MRKDTATKAPKGASRRKRGAHRDRRGPKLRERDANDCRDVVRRARLCWEALRRNPEYQRERIALGARFGEAILTGPEHVASVPRVPYEHLDTELREACDRWRVSWLPHPCDDLPSPMPFPRDLDRVADVAVLDFGMPDEIAPDCARVVAGQPGDAPFVILAVNLHQPAERVMALLKHEIDRLRSVLVSTAWGGVTLDRYDELLRAWDASLIRRPAQGRPLRDEEGIGTAVDWLPLTDVELLVRVGRSPPIDSVEFPAAAARARRLRDDSARFVRLEWDAPLRATRGHGRRAKSP